MTVLSPGRRRAVTMLALLPWTLVLFQFLLVLPRYDKLFREFNLPLPTLTRYLLDASAWVKGNAFLAFVLTFVLMGLSVGAAHGVQSVAMSRARRTLALLVVFGLPCGLFVLAWLGVLVSHRTLLEGLDR